jgi:hypothetical protein
MARERGDEMADRVAEERSENEGMPEHPTKARDPVRWAADRSKRVRRSTAAQPPSHNRMFGLALLSCAALAALASARGAFRWIWHKGGVARLPR